MENVVQYMRHDKIKYIQKYDRKRDKYKISRSKCNKIKKKGNR